ncbi:MAG: hypothetical protein Alpg2KO_23500 [Alphaproteobacteria bacterium]
MSKTMNKYPTLRAIVNVLYLCAIAAGIMFGMYFLSQFNNIARIEFLGMIYEMQVGLLIGVLILLVAAGGYGFYLLVRLWHAPGEIKQNWDRDGERRGWRALTDGLVAVAAGDKESARKHARNASALMDAPHVSALLLAQVAQMDRDGIEARKHFSAMLEHDDTAFMGARGLMVEALRDGQRGEALEYAREAHAKQPSSGWVLEQLVELEAHEGNWRDALDALDGARAAKVYDKATANHHEAAIRVAQASGAQADGDTKRALKLARMAMDAEPGFIPGPIMAATLEIAEGNRSGSMLKKALTFNTAKTGAIKIIEAGWKAQPNVPLARLWMEIAPLNNPKQRVEWARRLLKLNSSGTPGHLMLGEALLDAKRYDEAEEEFTRAQNIENTRRVHRARYKLAEARGASDATLRDLLARAAMAAPDPAWICSECGHMSDKWHLFCPDQECNSFNSMEWRIPDTPPLFEDALELSHHGMTDEQIAAVEGRTEPEETDAEPADSSDDSAVIDIDEGGEPIEKQNA